MTTDQWTNVCLKQFNCYGCPYTRQCDAEQDTEDKVYMETELKWVNEHEEGIA